MTKHNDDASIITYVVAFLRGRGAQDTKPAALTGRMDAHAQEQAQPTKLGPHGPIHAIVPDANAPINSMVNNGNLPQHLKGWWNDKQTSFDPSVDPVLISTDPAKPLSERTAYHYAEQYVLDTFVDWLGDNADRLRMSASDLDCAVEDFHKSLRPQREPVTKPVTAGGYVAKSQNIAEALAYLKHKPNTDNYGFGFIDYARYNRTPITSKDLAELEREYFAGADRFSGRLEPNSFKGMDQREVILAMGKYGSVRVSSQIKAIDAYINGKLGASPSSDHPGLVAYFGLGGNSLYFNEDLNCFQYSHRHRNMLRSNLPETCFHPGTRN